jgi:benzil reductase ((S)-benzoin forming)
MSITLSIVTGASRGLGRAVAAQLLARGHAVIAISRQAPQGLSHPQLQHWPADLADARAVSARLQAWLAQQGPQAFAGAEPDQQRRRDLAAGAAGRWRGRPGQRRARGAGSADAADRGLPAATAAGPCRARWCWCRRAWAAARWPAARRTAPPRPGWTTWRVPWRWKKRPSPTARASCRWRRVSSTPTCRCNCAAPTRPRSPSASAFIGLHSGGQLDSPDAGRHQAAGYLDRADFGSNPVGDVRDA